MEEKTVLDLFYKRIREDPDDILHYEKVEGSWRGTTAAEIEGDTRSLACGLRALGLRKGDRVGILSRVRHEWLRADLAVLANGAVTVGIYSTLTPAQVHYILEHSEARFLFVEDMEQLQKVVSCWARLPGLESVILFDPPPSKEDMPEECRSRAGGCLSLKEVVHLGDVRDSREPETYEQVLQSVGPDDLASIVYTSGTTGPPKGAMLTHRNLCSVVLSVVSVMPYQKGDVGVIFLPLSHILQRVISYGGMYIGARGAYAESIDKLIDNFREIRPTVQVSVPRIWEKIHQRVIAAVEEGSPLKRLIFKRAMTVGHQMAEYRARGDEPPISLEIRYALADRLVFRKVKDIFGGRIRFLTSGGAPLSEHIARFFYAMGLLILEGYGLTETAAPACVNRIDDFRFGTVGKPIPGMEIRIGEDGEILIRGAGVFMGYYKNPAATAEALDEDGWLHTGDIGEIDADGFLRVTDRKKDIIITSGGKNIAPQNVENLLKTSPYISQAMVYGDRRKYLTVLITLDREELLNFARKRGLEGEDMGALCRHPEVENLVAGELERANEELAGFETVKKFRILDREFTVEDGTLTPTLKVKRKVVARRYRELLEAMYEE
jgi:long-chain acyl-CoA synthetase